MITELKCPVEVITPKGNGWCYWLIDYGPNSNVLWGVVITNTQEVWWIRNQDIRITDNYTMNGDKRSV